MLSTFIKYAVWLLLLNMQFGHCYLICSLATFIRYAVWPLLLNMLFGHFYKVCSLAKKIIKYAD